MTPASLMGEHIHRTTCGINVYVWQRGGNYMARGRFDGKMFGQTLGRDAEAAKARLRRILTDLENGTFVRPTEARKRPLKPNQVPSIDLRGLCNDFLGEKRKLRGADTAADYQSRLAHLLDFAEGIDARRRWPLARDVNRDFVIGYREFLMSRRVARNGRPGAAPRAMSLRHVGNCLDMLRTLLAWGASAAVRRLPVEFVNPVTPDLVPQPPAKDPLRSAPIPLDRRIGMAEAMDRWQFLHLSPLLVLPLRFEDLAGLLVSDVDFEGRTLRLGTRLDGSDFNKGRMTVRMPLPEELVPILRICAGGRVEGPLFRSRAAFEKPKAAASVFSTAELTGLFHAELAAKAGSVAAEQDRKSLFRGLLRRLGGVSEDRVGKELRSLLGDDSAVRPYDVRASVSQEMQDSGMGLRELRYLTLHTVRDIMDVYTALAPAEAMGRYFERIRPLLDVVRRRLADFGGG